MDISTFIGRFHPVFVHLPIGFVLLAIIAEGYKSRKGKPYSGFISFSWFVGGVSACMAAFLGWLLALDGGYTNEGLFWHRWLGIVLVVVSFAGWYLKRKPDRYAMKIQWIFNVFVIVLLFVEGHLGGNLTHGENYLVEYAPRPIRILLGDKTKPTSFRKLEDPDTIVVYPHMIQPVLQLKCFSCHNDDVQRGGLNMSNLEALKKGGDHGPVLEAGHPFESALFHRVTLPQNHVKFMPPKGEVLTYDEIQLMEWWIKQGAFFDKQLTDVTLTEEIKLVFMRLYGLNMKPKPLYKKLNLPVLDSTALEVLQDVGFLVKIIADDNQLLDVKYQKKTLAEEQLKALNGVKDHVTWLSLANCNIQDEHMEMLAEFRNLTRLQLEKNPITDRGISFLKGLEHIETLNLYKTQVTDAALSVIGEMPSLKRVYLWETRVSLQAVRKLEEEQPHLEVVLGFLP